MTVSQSIPETVLSDPVTILRGDVREMLRGVPAGSIDVVVTSPPYFGLRDYGEASQIGLEETPVAFVETIVGVFGEVWRVLADHGTVWLNLGDSYVGGGGFSPGAPSTETSKSGRYGVLGSLREGGIKPSGSVKAKELVGIPWRVAFALQDAGWFLRSEIIWEKPNGMPESVTDRPTKSHETIFLLAKRSRYYFDQEAVRERYADGPGLTGGAYSPPGQTPHGNARGPDGRKKTVHDHATPASHPNYDGVGNGNERWPHGGRNIRSVWTIPTQAYPDAHFATFPEALVDRCLAAGAPLEVCVKCGQPRERIVAREDLGLVDRSFRSPHRTETDGMTNGEGGTTLSRAIARETEGWTDCGHGNYRPGRVLDPFLGSGTTGVVARRRKLSIVGVELNPEYAAMAERRISRYYVKPKRPAAPLEAQETLFG